MPRYARINVPLGIYHIISRTLRKEYLIKGPEERLCLRQLGQVLIGAVRNKPKSNDD